MRTLWILFSALVSAAAVALYVGSPVDPLQWAADLVFGTGTLHLPAAGPVTRFADAALAGATVAYFLIFVPLSIGTWFDGGRQARTFRSAVNASSDGTLGESWASPAGTASAWWPLLALFSAGTSDRPDAPGNADATKTGRTSIIDNLVANQSAAPVFRDFPMVAIGLGLIALIGQLLPVLAADPAAIVAGSNSALLGSATARGFCSLVAATAAAAVFGLVSQLIGAILRRRAETIFGTVSLAIRQRRWSSLEEGEPAQASLLVTPLPNGTSERPGGRERLAEDTLIEHAEARLSAIPDAAGRQMVESVESALRDIQNTTLRPMLHDISRLLSLLGDRAGHLVETVDDRLRLHTEHTRQILAAIEEITRTLNALTERGGSVIPGQAVDADSAPGMGIAPLQELRQTLNEERAAAAEILRSIGQDLTGRLDGALRTTARSIMKPVSSQTEAINRAAERIDATTAAMERVGALIEASTGTIEQKLDRLVSAQQSGLGAGADAAGVAGAAREALEAIAALSTQLKADRAPTAQPRTAPLSAAGSWAQRISDLHRASLDLTSDLPALHTSAFTTPVSPGASAADELARERQELAELDAETQAWNEKPAG